MRYWLAALLLCTAVLAVAAPEPAAQEQAELEAVKERIAEVQAGVEADRASRDALSAALANIEGEIDTAVAALAQLEAEIAQSEQRIDTLAAQAATQQGQLDASLSRLGDQVRAAHRVGRQGQIQLILSQDDPSELGRLLVYYEYYAKAQSQSLTQSRLVLAALTETRRSLEAERQQLQQQRTARSEAVAVLETQRAERAQALAAVETRLSQRGDELAALRADEAELQALLEELRERLADIPAPDSGAAFTSLKGSLPPPVSGPLIAAFGQAKADGRLRWQGQWLAAPSGAPVTAAAAGRVVYVGRMHRYGLIVVLDHGDDYYTIYGHNQTVYAEAGDQVRAGQSIAAAGSSGGHTASGVYFEIRRGRKSVDPAHWLAS